MRWTTVLALLPLPGLGSCFLFPIAVAASAEPFDTPIGEPAVAHGALVLGTTRWQRDWQPADDVGYGAFDADRRIADSPIWFSSIFGVGYTEDTPSLAATDGGVSSFTDWGFGMRHYEALGPFEPFVGTGLALVDRRYTRAAPDYDYSYGVFFEAGLHCALVRRFAVGVLARYYVGSEPKFDGHSYDADYATFGIELVYRR